MGLSRKHLPILTGLLTGHVVLNRHLTVMKICTDPLCPKCGEEEETAYHFLGRCNAMIGCVAQLAERRSLAGELTLSCARPAADG